jgi:cytochrome c oxidase subunit 3
MSNYLRHPYHLVDESPWPLIAALGGLGITSGLLKWFHFNRAFNLLFRITFLLIVTFQWWRDVRREGTYLGQHTGIVELGLRWGIILFIVSEVFFFKIFLSIFS